MALYLSVAQPPEPVLGFVSAKLVLIMNRFLIAVAAVALCSNAAGAATKYLRFGKVIDGKGKVWTDAAIVVDDDRVRAVEGDSTPPAGAEVLDLRRYTAIPGLIDAHTHMTYYWDRAPGTTP